LCGLTAAGKRRTVDFSSGDVGEQCSVNGAGRHGAVSGLNRSLDEVEVGNDVLGHCASLSFSLSLLFSFSLSLSLSSLSFLSLSLSLSSRCVLRHHCGAAVMVRCDGLFSSLWSPCVSPLILQSSSLFLELSLCSSLSLSFSLSLFLFVCVLLVASPL